MANQVDIQVLEEGPRNAVVRVTAYIDTSNVVLAPAITLAQFLSNDPSYTKLVGLRVDRVQFTVDTDLVVAVYWNSAAPQLLGTYSDSNSLEYRAAGGLQPNMSLSGYDGSINISTAGYTAGNQVGFDLVFNFAKLYAR